MGERKQPTPPPVDQRKPNPPPAPPPKRLLVTREQLARIEWQGGGDGGEADQCPACREYESAGHRTDCWLALALKDEACEVTAEVTAGTYGLDLNGLQRVGIRAVPAREDVPMIEDSSIPF